MSKEILIHVANGEKHVAVVVDGKADHLYIERDLHPSRVGNIYKGKAQDYGFINIEPDTKGFLNLADEENPFLSDVDYGKIERSVSIGNKISNIFNKRQLADSTPVTNKKELPVEKGEEVLVQVIKDLIGTKNAELSTKISLPGRFVVYMPWHRHDGIPKKTKDLRERHRFREILKSFNFAHSGGFIVRTASVGATETEIIRDAKFLTAIWEKIQNLSKQKQGPVLVYQEYDFIWRVVRDLLKSDVDRLIIDSREEYMKLRTFAETLAGKAMAEKIQHHAGGSAIFEAGGIASQIKAMRLSENAASKYQFCL